MFLFYLCGFFLKLYKGCLWILFMGFKFRSLFSNDEAKYEVLHHKFSKLKLDNHNLKKSCDNKIQKFEDKVLDDVSASIIELYRQVEVAKSSAYRVDSTSKEIQNLIVDVNKVGKLLKKLMKNYDIKEVVAEERYYEAEKHNIASYDSSEGMKKGLIVKTVKKGFKVRGRLVEKPSVVITK